MGWWGIILNSSAMTYNIAEIRVTINSEPNNEWKIFRENLVEDKSPNFKVIFLENLETIHGLECLDFENNYCHLTRVETEVMLADKEWKNGIILPSCKIEYITSFLLQMFYTHAVQKKMIQIHSSLLQYKDEGIVFLGPSGIGKTTQAELWNKYRNASIINGDISFIQEKDEKFYGWGTPWHGSSPYCANTNVPIHSLIVLKQSLENSIRELTGFEKVTAVSQNVFYPRWLENGMELCLETLDHLLTKIPVYELSCRPDEDAVRLTEETIFEKDVV